MKTHSIRWKGLDYFVFSLLFPLIIFAGCAKKVAIGNAADEDILRQRVKAYWDLKIEEDFTRTYEYEDPFYRKTATVVDYVRGFTGSIAKWKEADIKELSMSDDTAKVKMAVNMEIGVPQQLRPGVMAPGPAKEKIRTKTVIEDSWIKVDGLWYHVMPKRGLRK